MYLSQSFRRPGTRDCESTWMAGFRLRSTDSALPHDVTRRRDECVKSFRQRTLRASSGNRVHQHQIVSGVVGHGFRPDVCNAGTSAYFGPSQIGIGFAPWRLAFGLIIFEETEGDGNANDFGLLLLADGLWECRGVVFWKANNRKRSERKEWE